MPFEFDWVDAFTARPFGGNGCAVIYGAAGMDDALCQAIVRETSLTECTFLGPSDMADIRVRYFLAHKELPFAGHPTIATVASMIDRGIAKAKAITLETKAGIIPIRIDHGASGGPMITMTQVRPEFGPVMDPGQVAAVGGLQVDDILGSPRIVSTGVPFCVTLVKDHAALRRVRLDTDALKAFRAATGVTDADVMEPFWVALEGATEGGHTFSRLLMAPPAPMEDAFTGSATGSMAAYLWAEGILEKPRFIAEQGHWMGRPGQATVEVLGPREDISGVRVGGQGYVLMRGYLNL